MCSMKIKIVGNGELAHNYLTIGKVYEATKLEELENVALITCDNGEQASINYEVKDHCGFLYNATGDLHWEIVEE